MAAESFTIQPESPIFFQGSIELIHKTEEIDTGPTLYQTEITADPSYYDTLNLEMDSLITEQKKSDQAPEDVKLFLQDQATEELLVLLNNDVAIASRSDTRIYPAAKRLFQEIRTPRPSSKMPRNLAGTKAPFPGVFSTDDRVAEVRRMNTGPAAKQARYSFTDEGKRRTLERAAEILKLSRNVKEISQEENWRSRANRIAAKILLANNSEHLLEAIKQDLRHPYIA